MPGPQARLGLEEVELGLGIHGEPGRMKISPPPPAGDLVRRMLCQLTNGPYLRLKTNPRVVLLVNNLGATPALELSTVTAEALTILRKEHGVKVERLYVGPYMTSLDMAGMSLTLLSYDVEDEEHGDGWDELLELLDATTDAPGWGGLAVTSNVPGPYDPSSYEDMPAPLPAGGDGIEVPPPPPSTRPSRRDSGSCSSSSSGDEDELSPEDVGKLAPPNPSRPRSQPGEVLGHALRAAARALLTAASELDDIDSKVGTDPLGTLQVCALQCSFIPLCVGLHSG